MGKSGKIFFYWFWKLLSAGVGILIGCLINPATWGLSFDMDNQALYLFIRIALILIVFFILSSFVKKPKKEKS